MIKTWQQRCEEHPDHDGVVSDEMIRARMQEEIDELRAAIEQAQEPVACQYAKDVSMPEYRCAVKCQYAQPAQQPVAWMYHGVSHDGRPHDRPSLIFKPEHMDAMSESKGAQAVPLYTAPSQGQGLTDEEIRRIELAVQGYTRQPFNVKAFARAIEAKLLER